MLKGKQEAEQIKTAKYLIILDVFNAERKPLSIFVIFQMWHKIIFCFEDLV
jgi:hypothetical protein